MIINQYVIDMILCIMLISAFVLFGSILELLDGVDTNIRTAIMAVVCGASFLLLTSFFC